MGGCVGDGRGAHTRFVGEHTPGAANAQGLQTGANHAAGDGPGRKGPLEDGLYGLRQSIPPGCQHKQAQQNVSPGSKGHQPLCRSADAPGTAQEHSPHQHRQQQSQPQVPGRTPAPQQTVDAGHHRIDLCRVAHAKGGNDAEKAVQRSQPAPPRSHA